MLDRLFPHQENVARYLPAISHGYARVANDPSWHCEGLPGTMLDYLRAGGVFRYPAALASAGQVIRESGSLDSTRTIITDRDPTASFVVADSGGFQIQQGTLGPWRGKATVLQSLRWQEQHSDYVMALDFPTGGIDTGKMAQHVHRLIHVEGEPIEAMSRTNGLSVPFNACLRQTVINTDMMLTYRRPDRRFLVVLQGTSEPESREWYQAHKHFIAEAEGIAFAGESKTSYRLMLHRLIDMRDDGNLARIKHIHVLGTGTFESGCILTTIQRCIRDSINRELQITFDTATPFQEANERYQLMAWYTIDRVKLSWKYLRPSEATLSGNRYENEFTVPINHWCHTRVQHERNRLAKNFSYRVNHGRPTPYAAVSMIGRTLAPSDVAVYRREKDDPDPLNHIIKPDSRTSLLMCAHNVDAITRAMETVIGKWISPVAELRNDFPQDLLVIRTITEMLFNKNHVVGLMDELTECKEVAWDAPRAELPAPKKGKSPYQAHAFIEENRRYLDALVD
ncbi:hypothetical protein [Methylorubrum extorquens]|uniref:Uncharacterized protein n=1 Tax=Methylorubrum extorquens TaxID=408 RepID=A0AAX3WHR8_METEX|nr:hypothetical protein [Methylorubrum extorquens]WHQ70205.1 hypothetical protein KEC54_00590 [Methylorubrum extorquens]